MPRPDLTRVFSFYHNYIGKVTGDDLQEEFKKGTSTVLEFLNTIPPEKYDHRYAEGKWSVREILQHLIDAERIFSYRALCFARKDTTPLPGFEENDYVANAKTEKRSWKDLVEEFTAVRKSTLLMFSSFDDDQLEAGGTANNNPIYVRAIGFICVGHSLHHMAIIKERYL